MAKMLFNNADVKLIDFSDTKLACSIFGNVAKGDSTIIGEALEAQKAWTGMAVIGANERFIYDELDSLIVAPDATHRLVSGELRMERENAGFLFVKGKFPEETAKLDLILSDLLTGTKTIGGALVTTINPVLNTTTTRTRS